MISLCGMLADFRIKGVGVDVELPLDNFVVDYVQSEDDWFYGHIDVPWTAPNSNDVEYVAVYEGKEIKIIWLSCLLFSLHLKRNFIHFLVARSKSP